MNSTAFRADMRYSGYVADLVQRFVMDARILSEHKNVRNSFDLDKVQPIEDRLAFRILESAFGQNEQAVRQGTHENDLLYFTLATTNLIRKREVEAGKKRLLSNDISLQKYGFSEFDAMDREVQNKHLLAWALSKVRDYYDPQRPDSNHGSYGISKIFMERVDQLKQKFVPEIETPVLPGYIFTPDGKVTPEAKAGFKINEQTLDSAVHLRAS